MTSMVGCNKYIPVWWVVYTCMVYYIYLYGGLYMASMVGCTYLYGGLYIPVWWVVYDEYGWL